MKEPCDICPSANRDLFHFGGKVGKFLFWAMLLMVLGGGLLLSL